MDVRATLLSLKEVFVDNARECLSSFFQVNSSVREPWDVVERLNGTFDHISSIGSSNHEYQAIMVAAIQQNALGSFLKTEAAADDIPDIFGEFCNTYCGMLMDSQQFKDAFGILRQAIPMYSEHQSFFPRVWAIAGKLFVDTEWIYIGYAIRSLDYSFLRK